MKPPVIPVDSLLQLRQRLDHLPPKSPERAAQVAAVAQLYGVSAPTVSRALKAFPKPRAAPSGGPWHPSRVAQGPTGTLL